MPSHNGWLAENRVLFSYPYGIVTLEELAAANVTLNQHLEDAAAAGFAQVHLLVDASNVHTQPSPIATQRVFTYMGQKNLGWTVIGGAGNPILYFFTRFVSTLVQSRTRMFPTPIAALEFLMRQDDTLPELIAPYQAWLKDR